MPVIYIHGHPVIEFSVAPREKYWAELSEFLIMKYGYGPFTDHGTVETILLDCFHYLENEFLHIVNSENAISFFFHVFYLHEESIIVHDQYGDELSSHGLDEKEFPYYRRVLKLILEQGCDIDLVWGSTPSQEEIFRYLDKIVELYYLGAKMYEFADIIAMHKMVENGYKVTFYEDDWLVIYHQYHFGSAYQQLFSDLKTDYKEATFDQNISKEFRSKIETSFGIEWDFAAGIIFEIKRHHRPKNPKIQTIQADVLPINLAAAFSISARDAELFYNGLTLSRKNKLSLGDSVYKPYSMQRHLFRPILMYNIEGEERALVGEEKFAESMFVMSTNALHWVALPKEWLEMKGIRQFMNEKALMHDRILGNKIEGLLKERKLLYSKNVKSIRQKEKSINIEIPSIGEIDFLIISHLQKRIFVVECKYNRARYEMVGFRADNSNFINDYEKKLSRKTEWVFQNKVLVEEHFKIIHRQPELKIKDYSVEGIFLINTPTFYMFNGDFKTYTLNKVPELLEGRFQEKQVLHVDEETGVETIITHPYFKKPIPPSRILIYGE